MQCQVGPPSHEPEADWGSPVPGAGAVERWTAACRMFRNSGRYGDFSSVLKLRAMCTAA